MQERNNVWAGVAMMALVGGVVTALLYTDRGRQSLTRLEDALDDFSRSLQHLRGAVQKAGQVAAQGIDVATEGMDAVSGLIGRTERRLGPSVAH